MGPSSAAGTEPGGRASDRPTSEGPQHGLQVGVSDQGGGGLQAEGLLQPVQESGGDLDGESAGPLGEHGHGVHQGSFMHWKTEERGRGHQRVTTRGRAEQQLHQAWSNRHLLAVGTG